MTMKKIFVLLALVIFSSQINAANLGSKSGKMWHPYLEWSVTNTSFSGNPYDVIATATFSHSGSSSTHKTEMFYAGNNTWKFRFAGTRTGTWNFTTSSSDPELNGHTGSASISSNANATGFLTNSGNKFAMQKGDNGTLQPYRLNIFMTDTGGYITDVAYFRSGTANKARTYARAAKNNGMNAVYLSVNHNWLKLGANKNSEHNSTDPDPDTYAVLEQFITTAKNEGVHVYLWAWGDDDRDWSPSGLPGGMNGTVHKRIQRYTAARLGPIAGWSMGLGFDLDEWTSSSSRNAWATYLHSRFGWDHLLSTRGFRLSGNNNINGYSSRGDQDEVLDTQSKGGPHTYNEGLADLQSDLSKPTLYEERHVFERDKIKASWIGWKTTTSMDGTRRLIWRNTLAGGIGGWFGFFNQNPVFGSGSGYPNPEQLVTATTFWDDNERFLMDMRAANNLTDGMALRTNNNRNFVFYKENTSSIQMNLSSMSGNQNAIAVDTKRSYGEVAIGNLNPVNMTWDAPYSSDWAIAVGSFNGNTPSTADTTPPAPPRNLIAR